jgi:peptidoglycan lytic transglycosylase
VQLTAVRSAPRSLLIAAVALLLAACASTPKRPGFYQEDGPPEHVPAGLLATPDAVPRVEPVNPFANRPYVALGRTYVPDTSDAPFRQRGLASWYGRQFQGNRTASGEPYDMFAMTAAHPTLPIPSYARVTRVSDGRSVVVRINDRGPFYRDRVIDLSYAAAARLGLAGPGSGEVEIQRILPTQMARAAPTPDPSPAARERGTFSSSAGAEAAGVRAAADAGTVALAVAPAGTGPASTALPSSQLPIEPAVAPPPAASGTHWSVQLGAFAVPANAEALRDRLALLLSSPEAADLPAELRSPRIEVHGGLTRVLIGVVADRTVALQWSRVLERFLARPTALFAR